MELSLELTLFNKKTVQYNSLQGILFEESLDNKKELFHKKITLTTEKILLNEECSILRVLRLLLLAKLSKRDHWGNIIVSNVGSKTAVSNSLEKMIDIFSTMNEREKSQWHDELVIICTVSLLLR